MNNTVHDNIVNKPIGPRNNKKKLLIIAAALLFSIVYVAFLHSIVVFEYYALTNNTSYSIDYLKKTFSTPSDSINVSNELNHVRRAVDIILDNTNTAESNSHRKFLESSMFFLLKDRHKSEYANEIAMAFLKRYIKVSDEQRLVHNYFDVRNDNYDCLIPLLSAYNNNQLNKFIGPIYFGLLKHTDSFYEIKQAIYRLAMIQSLSEEPILLSAKTAFLNMDSLISIREILQSEQSHMNKQIDSARPILISKPKVIKYFKYRGYIIENIGTNRDNLSRFEQYFADNDLGGADYGHNQYLIRSTSDPSGAILLTKQTKYESSGYFALQVFLKRTDTFKGDDGFDKEINVYQEMSEEDIEVYLNQHKVYNGALDYFRNWETKVKTPDIRNKISLRDQLAKQINNLTVQIHDYELIAIQNSLALGDIITAD